MGQWPESLPRVLVSLYSSQCLLTSMQVPRRREKADNVWAEESWNQFMQELETGQKVSVGLVLWEWMTLSQCILASELAPSDSPSHLQPKKPLVDDPTEKPSQPIEVSAAGKVGEGETAMLGDKGESLGDAGPGDHGQRTQIPQLPPSPAPHSSSLYPQHPPQCLAFSRHSNMHGINVC